LIGERRARVAAAHPETTCTWVCDTNDAAARRVSEAVGARSGSDWRSIVASPDVDVVVAATPNAFLADIACAALEHGKHVLVEKPMGRDVNEARRMAAAGRAAKRLLKVGFNHRYHPAIAEAHRRLRDGEIGDVIWVRCRYGHGGRAGYEREWRGNRALSGGGELTDQGVHVVDLLHWFVGVPKSAFATLQTAVWPLGDLEDNAFGVFEFPKGVVASFHTSWTQWKNLFSLEVFGEKGALIVEGLGRSYGVESLTLHRRRAEGGAPDTSQWTYEGEDESWLLEWNDFVTGITTGRPILGGANDGIVAMEMLDALYRGARARAFVPVNSAGALEE
jgi:predicted dehydrogenase